MITLIIGQAFVVEYRMVGESIIRREVFDTPQEMDQFVDSIRRIEIEHTFTDRQGREHTIWVCVQAARANWFVQSSVLFHGEVSRG